MRVARAKESGRATTELIMRAVRHNPGISRIALAQALGLDKSTITNQISALIAAGLVLEVSEGDSSIRGGRKPIHLSLNPRYGVLIGIEIQVESWVAVLVDLSGDILAELRGAVHISAENFDESALGIIRQCRAAFCVPDGDRGSEGDRLLGIGIGTGGLIDPARKIINYSVPLDIRTPIDFASRVASRVDVPCYIDNDANCCAWGELSFQHSPALGDFLFALVEYRKDRMSLGQYGGLGVGFGTVFGGKVYSGQHGNAGEFRSAFCDGPGELQFSQAKEVLSRIESDSEAHGAVMDELARNMAMLVNTMDFNHIFIGGDIGILGPAFPALLRKRLEENWMYPSPKDVVIGYSSYGDVAVSCGAAGMAFERILAERGLPAPGSD